MLSFGTSINRIGDLLISLAALMAACDCQGAVGGIDDRAAGESAAVQSDKQPDSMPADSSVRRQNQLTSSAAEARRSRSGRGRRGYIDDVLNSLCGMILWLGSALANVAAMFPSYGLLIVGLCLAIPLQAQDRLWPDGRTPLGEPTSFPEDALLVAMVPPRDNAIFAPPPPSNETRYLPEGNGWIVTSNPMEYPRIPALDCDDPSSVFYTYRANLFGIDVPDEWDFYNLISTDRPDFTDATFSVGTGVTIIETGYTYRRAFDHEANVE